MLCLLYLRRVSPQLGFEPFLKLQFVRNSDQTLESRGSLLVSRALPGRTGRLSKHDFGCRIEGLRV